MKLLSVVLLTLFTATVQALPPDLEARLTQIYDTNEFDTKRFGPARWMEEGAGYTVLEPARAGEQQGRELVRYDSASGKRTVLASLAQLTPLGAAQALTIDDYALSKDSRLLVIHTNSRTDLQGPRTEVREVELADLWTLDFNSGELRKVAEAIEGPGVGDTLSPDGKRVVFIQAHNVFVAETQGGSSTQLTWDGVPDTLGNGVNDWGDALVRWSPDSTRMAFGRYDSSQVGRFPMLNYTDEVYPVPHYIRYPKVGTPIPSWKIGIVDVSKTVVPATVAWVHLPDTKFEGYLEDTQWTASSRELVIQRITRSKDSLDLILADAVSGDCRILHNERDKAWVLDVFAWSNGLAWDKKERSYIWLSEKSGWRRAYSIDRESARETALTPQGIDVIRPVQTDEKRGSLYYLASPDNATQRYLYRTRLDGKGSPERLSPANQPGTHSYDISPDARFAIHTYSTADAPPVTELIRLPTHQRLRMLEDNAELRARFAALKDRPTEFFKLDIGSGIVMDAWMLKPRDFDPAKKYPVFIFVYAEPASPTVTDSWSNGQAQGLYHRAIADTGYLVISIENRGTPVPKGSAWRRASFGSLGPLSTEEQAAALTEFGRKHPYADLARVGIWGWSAGGTNTLNALFRKPDQYQVGISVAPKPRPDLYNAWFQETFMRTPETNPDGYKTAAPLNYAEGLKGDLLIIHGTGDDNSHLQITELVVNRLIELNKPFDYFAYPNRTHSISEGPGTSLHLRMLMTRYLTEHLPAGGR